MYECIWTHVTIHQIHRSCHCLCTCLILFILICAYKLMNSILSFKYNVRLWPVYDCLCTHYQYTIICSCYMNVNSLSTRPHQNVFWYNNYWLGFLKILNYVPKERESFSAENDPSFVTVKCCNGSIGIILGKIICESSNWQHIQRLKITILGANWQLMRLERIAKCLYFILSTQNIKFYWFVMKIKKFLFQFDDTIEDYFLLGINIFGSSFWMG